MEARTYTYSPPAAISIAERYLKKDGSEELTDDWDIGEGRKVLAEEIRARDGNGLRLLDDGGTGLCIEDGGNVGIGADPIDTLYLADGAVTIGGTTPMGVIRGYGINIGGSYKFGKFGSGTSGIAFMFQDTGNFYIMPSAAYDSSSAVQANSAVFTNAGYLGLGTYYPTARIDAIGDILRLRTAKTPASASATGNQGDICWDADYIYVCVATNTWKRVALATW